MGQFQTGVKPTARLGSWPITISRIESTNANSLRPLFMQNRDHNLQFVQYTTSVPSFLSIYSKTLTPWPPITSPTMRNSPSSCARMMVSISALLFSTSSRSGVSVSRLPVTCLKHPFSMCSTTISLIACFFSTALTYSQLLFGP